MVRLGDGFDGIRVLGEDLENRFGFVVNAAGDFNGDGFADFTVTAPNYLKAGSDMKFTHTYLIYGGVSRPRPLMLLRAEPDWGPLRGGTVVTLVGEGFKDETNVFFKGRPAASIRRISGSQLEVVTPYGDTVGFVGLVATNPTERVSLDPGFEYIENFPEIDLNHPDPGLVLEAAQAEKVSSVDMGDLSGDGIDDFVFPSHSDSGNLKIAVIRGGPDLTGHIMALEPSERTSLIIRQSTEAPSHPGAWVLGDVNADGIRDLGIVQAEASSYILFGRREWEREIDIDLEAEAGRAVKLLPGRDPTGTMKMVNVEDLTGDGIDDIVVGFGEGRIMPDDPFTALQKAGEILFLKGRIQWPRVVDLGNPETPFSRIRGSIPDQGFASILQGAGDINRDGYLDLLADGQLVADPFADKMIYLIYGSPTLPISSDINSLLAQGGGVAFKMLPEYHLNDSFNPSGPGDVDGDGYRDILIGHAQGGLKKNGIVYLIKGGPAMPWLVEVRETPPVPWDGIVRILGAGSYYCTSKSSGIGDFNADGIDDFILGDVNWMDIKGKAGNAYLIFGREKMPETIELSRLARYGIQIRSRNDQYGIGPIVGPWGDLNADGQPDFAVGELARLTQDSEKRFFIYVIYGPYGEKGFIRGDANQDGKVDISDGIAILTYLFMGGLFLPSCLDALDVDDTGILEITDGIRLLTHLFLGDPPPPMPYPRPGPDPTQDGLGCRGF